jgi:hypothetical protein
VFFKAKEMITKLISRTLIAAWIIVIMLLAISSGVTTYQSFLQPVLLRDKIINPWYNSVPLDRSSDGLVESDEMEERNRGLQH